MYTVHGLALLTHQSHAKRNSLHMHIDVELITWYSAPACYGAQQLW